MESKYPDGWKTSEIPPYDITRRIPHIMGFEFDIDRIEGKFKLGQDEPKKDALAVARRLAQSQDPAHRELANMVFAYNMDRSDD
jgi:transcriptional regulator